MQRLLPAPCRRLSGNITLEDLAATISESAMFVGSSLHGAITALAYERPFVILNLAGEPKLDGFAALTGTTAQLAHHPADVPDALAGARSTSRRAVEQLQRQVDAHFDRMAEVAVDATRRQPQLEALRGSA
jgi:polysaccharide pyruvyl transferase WcaK-like protein